MCKDILTNPCLYVLLNDVQVENSIGESPLPSEKQDRSSRSDVRPIQRPSPSGPTTPGKPRSPSNDGER